MNPKNPDSDTHTKNHTNHSNQTNHSSDTFPKIHHDTGAEDVLPQRKNRRRMSIQKVRYGCNV